MKQRLVKLSKFLSYLLRHHPESEGLALDEHGWAVIDELLAMKGSRIRGLSRAVLDRVVAENDKQRFEIDETGTKIRARQGHSLPVRLDLQEAVPPEYLYHGTASRHLASIRAHGLHKGSRHHVHFSLDRQPPKPWAAVMVNRWSSGFEPKRCMNAGTASS